MPSISKTTDNLGLIFAGSTEGPFEFDIELFGEGLGTTNLNALGITGPCGSFVNNFIPVNNGSGGYTKLSMVVPLDKNISFQPKFYRGGDRSVTENGIINVTRGSAGDGSAFAIDGEWMAIAGGSSQAGYSVQQFQVTTGSCPEGYGISILSTDINNILEPTTNGGGGVNVDNPTASPSIGTTAFSSATSSSGGTFPNTNYNFNGTFGSPGGAGAFAGNTGVAGKGNIRIYADTSGISTSGPIASVPGVTMQLISGTDGFWVGQSKVVVTSPVTGLSTTFIQDTDMSARELKALLEPTTDIAFDIELFGEGIGSIGLFNGNLPAPCGPLTQIPVANNSGSGGYTKLSMVVPLDKTISFQPKFYRGGDSRRLTLNENTGVTIETLTPSVAGDGAAFAIDGEWMAIAGGSGYIGWEGSITEVTTGSCPEGSGYVFYESTISNLVQPTTNGGGGVNILNPTASPSIGETAIIDSSFSTSGAPPDQFRESNATIRGPGGAGAPNGRAAGITTTISEAGKGNIRIYADTSGISTSGSIPSVPEVLMRLVGSSDGFWVGPSKVVVTNRVTGLSTVFTEDADMTAGELRSILYPGIPF